MNRRFIAALAAVLAGVSCTKEIQEISEPVSEGQQMLMTKIVGDTQGEFQQGSLLVKFDEETASGLASGEVSHIQGFIAQQASFQQPEQRISVQRSLSSHATRRLPESMASTDGIR